jgi:hypothetical protein
MKTLFAPCLVLPLIFLLETILQAATLFVSASNSTPLLPAKMALEQGTYPHHLSTRQVLNAGPSPAHLKRYFSLIPLREVLRHLIHSGGKS